MRLPNHVNPTQDAAKAPYNFIPLPERVVTIEPDSLPDQNASHLDRHTGYIDCLITTESPVYVRSPLTPAEFAIGEDDNAEKDRHWRELVKNKPDFFYADPGKSPRIPGSSLRGMLRTLVEIAGYGKVESVSGEQLVYRSVGDTTNHGERYRERIMRADSEGVNRSGKRCKRYTPLVKAGYMHEDANKDWHIRPAQGIGGTSFARIRIDSIPAGLEREPGCKNAYRIYVQAGPNEYQDVRGGFLQIKFSKIFRASGQPGPGLAPATLALSGPMASKRTEAVAFEADPDDAKLIQIEDKLIRAYRDQISQEQRDLLGEGGVLRAGQPVFYLEEKGKLVFFGHTMMMRLPYHKSPLDFVPEELRRPEDIDLADALFGFTKKSGDGKARAFAGRVFVGDAALEAGQDDIWLKPQAIVTPKILGTPKPTTFQHYLVQQQPDAQEVGRDRQGRPKTQKYLSDYAADTPKATVLRGHKVYWHKGNVPPADIEELVEKLKDLKTGREKEHDTQHTQIKPVSAGVKFRCRIRFENLTDVELGTMLWVLTLPGAPGKAYRHSIGMGKPYGMGAIKIEPALHLEDRAERYSSLLDEEGRWRTGSGQASAEAIHGFLTAFDRFVCSKIGAQTGSSLLALERIQTLFRLLEWPGPDTRDTRYLEIERPDPGVKRGKINEYKSRPVLPDPLHLSGGVRAAAPTRTAGQPQRPSPDRSQSAPRPAPAVPQAEVEVKPTPTPRQPAPKPAAKVELELSHPASIAEVTDGMVLQGKVVRVESGRVVVDILGQEASLPKDHIEPLIRDDYDMEERFPTGKTIRVLVRGRNKQGRLQLTMRRR